MHPIDPVLFWGMFVIVMVTLGTMLRDRFNSWYLPWRAIRSARIQHTPPSTLRDIIKRKDKVIAGLNAQLRSANANIGALMSENASQRNEIKTLLSRNILLANEVRCDQNAKTQALPYKFHAYRQWDEVDPEDH